MTSVRFSYQLIGAGWSVGSLAIGERKVAYECAYTTDPLADFVRALIALMRGSAQAECTWHSESAVLRWRFTRQGDDVAITTTAFRTPGDMRLERRGCGRMVGTCGLMQLAKEVRRELRAVLDAWGMEGYREQWILNSYPLAEAETLDKLIRGIPVEGPPPAASRRRKARRKRK